jgi:hypothetical protein
VITDIKTLLQPLHHAARGEHADVIRLLLASGASATTANSYGKVLVTIDFIMKIMFLISVLYLLLINCYGRLQANYLNQILKRTEFWNRPDELLHDHLQLPCPNTSYT